MIAIETGRPFRLGSVAEVVGGLGKARERFGMTCAERLRFARLGETLESVFADCPEHEQPLVAEQLEKAEVDEGREFAQLRIADRLGRPDWKAAREHREPWQQTLALSVEQVVTPFDCRAQSALPPGCVAGAVSQER